MLRLFGAAAPTSGAASGGLWWLRSAVVGHQVEHGHPDLAQVRAVLLEDLRADALAFADHAQQDVLGADEVVVQLQCLAERELEGLLRPRSERDVPAAAWLSRYR